MKLRDQNKLLLDLVVAANYQAYCAIICGQPSKLQLALFEDMHSPKIGDWVIEKSTVGMPERDAGRFGKLLRIEERPIWSVEEWEKEWEGYPAHERQPIPKDKFWVLEGLDGEEVSWNDCSFIKVIADRWWGSHFSRADREEKT